MEKKLLTITYLFSSIAIREWEKCKEFSLLLKTCWGLSIHSYYLLSYFIKSKSIFCKQKEGLQQKKCRTKGDKFILKDFVFTKVH